MKTPNIGETLEIDNTDAQLVIEGARDYQGATQVVGGIVRSTAIIQ